ncbi:hypothetical protein [Embleya sp. NPDC005575]|uniref:hypothetical protein n=1 Tax=Embleya sp. NPDC005575 TaxID=3156892 RepID=UPI0033BA251F
MTAWAANVRRVMVDSAGAPGMTRPESSARRMAEGATVWSETFLARHTRIEAVRGEIALVAGVLTAGASMVRVPAGASMKIVLGKTIGGETPWTETVSGESP